MAILLVDLYIIHSRPPQQIKVSEWGSEHDLACLLIIIIRHSRSYTTQRISSKLILLIFSIFFNMTRVRPARSRPACRDLGTDAPLKPCRTPTPHTHSTDRTLEPYYYVILIKYKNYILKGCVVIMPTIARLNRSVSLAFEICMTKYLINMHEKINVFNILHKSSLFYVFK